MLKQIHDYLKKFSDEEFLVECSSNTDFGDVSSNIALVVAKKEGKNPKEVAEELKTRIEKNLPENVVKVEVAGPGFLNFFFDEEYYKHELEKAIVLKEKYGTQDVGVGKTMIIDYSAPNIAKRFGIGHLRSTVIGQALYNIYKALGYKVIGDNHLGDWGTQFGTLLYQVNKKGLKESDLSINKLEELYIEFNDEAKKDEKLWDEARAWFKKLEDGDTEAKRLWKVMVDLSLSEFNRVYELLGVHIDKAYGESFYEDYMPQVIKLMREGGFTKKSEGAEIVEFKDMPPAMLTKSDGTTTYFTRDLATIHFRIGSWDPDLFIYEVGNEQSLHFRQVFEAARMLGWDKEYVHIGHGLYRWEHGKMSTREGSAIKLDEVLSKAQEKAREIIEKSETSRGLSHEEKDTVARDVGIGAVKYFDLSHQPRTDIVFDWDKIFMLEGNSAPYLQYTVARINSLAAKSEHKETDIEKLTLNKDAMDVLRLLSRFDGVLLSAAKNYSPNLVTNYLFELAQKFNFYYNEHKIIGSDEEELGIALSTAVKIVLASGLSILGINTPDRM